MISLGIICGVISIACIVGFERSVKSEDYNNINKRKQRNRYTYNDFLWALFLIFLGVAIATAQEVNITQKPDGLKVYTKDFMVHIIAEKDMRLLQLFDAKKRRMKFKPNNQSVIVNTVRLRKGDYRIALTMADSTEYLIKFNKQ